MGGSTNSLSHASHLLPPVFDARTICAHTFQSNTFGSSSVGAAPSLLSSSTVCFRLCFLPPLSRMSDTLAHASARSVSESYFAYRIRVLKNFVLCGARLTRRGCGLDGDASARSANTTVSPSADRRSASSTVGKFAVAASQRPWNIGVGRPSTGTCERFSASRPVGAAVDVRLLLLPLNVAPSPSLLALVRP